MSITTGEPPQARQPEQIQLAKSKSPPYCRHLFTKVRLQLLEEVLKQQRPDPFGVEPIGHVPSQAGVVQLLPAVAAARLQVKCSAFESRHKLPPVTVDDADANSTLNETLAVAPQLVPIRHIENATPVAAAQATFVPVGPVRFSVFRSLVPK